MPERILAPQALDRLGAYPAGTRLDGPDGLPRPDGLDATVVPKWTSQEIPQRSCMPLYDRVGPLVIDGVTPEVTVCPDVTADIVWFAPTAPVLTDFTLTVRREVRPGGGVAVSGGTAVLSVSVHGTPRGPAVPSLLPGDLRNLLEGQAPALAFVDPASAFALLPAPLSGLDVVLQLPAGVATEPPSVTVSPLAGSATIAVELSEPAVLDWVSALETGTVRALAGVVRATASVPTADPDNWFPGVDTQVLEAALGSLLAGRGAADIRWIDPQQTVSATVVVVGSRLVDRTTVALRPTDGQAPRSAVLGPPGGRGDITVVTRDPRSAAVDWRAEVAFTPPRWPVVPAAGRLDSVRGWITMLKPESWCAGYVLTVVPVDTAGRPVAAATRAGDRVQGVLNFTAPYVGGGLLSTAFEVEYGRPTSLVLPRYPDEAFGDLVVTLFADCGGTPGQSSRRLGEQDAVVTALVRPDGAVELHTAADSLPEASSGLSALLARLGSLTGRR
ncbi:hypothetical protein [Streptomyces zhihengii]|uniref:Uncharacterized protein n=1 Tax=Streptomyces zhihengii TaxID=1818004 RepID=A0ABS2UNC5_9ACTN|nr:hypothetical protein [Streptomyces zhihengii]MBM9618387.1 hypothetical protein [Streptomyces zhihengii]